MTVSNEPDGKIELTIKVQVIEPEASLNEVTGFLVGEYQGGAGRQHAVKFQRRNGRDFVVVMPDEVAEVLVGRLGPIMRRRAHKRLGAMTRGLRKRRRRVP